MSRPSPRFPWRPAGLTAVMAAGLLAPASAHAAIGTPDTGTYTHTAQLTIGDEVNARACSATLIAGDWLLGAKSCFGTDATAGAPKQPVKATVGSKTYSVTELAPRTDRDLILLRLDRLVTGATPAKLASAAPAAGAAVTAAGYGRTKTEWVPGKVHTASFKVSASTATTLTLDAAGQGNVICQGDAGGPVLNADGELAALNSRSWQGGCLGTDPAEARTGAVSVRTDDLRDWILQTRTLAAGWKTETLVQAGNTLYQGIRLAGGDWTGFTDLQTKVGDIGGIRTASAAGVNGDTHVLAISNNGRLFHTVRKADGTWGTFGDVGAAAGGLANPTQVSAVSIGYDLHVVAVADGKIFHTVRNATGHWTGFGDIAGAAGPIGKVTAAATASTGGQLQVTAISGGKAHHTIRNTTGHWTRWGDVAAAVGSATGPITAVTMAGVGNDAHIVIATDNGTRQYHAIRNGDGTWTSLGDLKDILGTVTAKSVSAAAVDGELQLAVTAADDKALLSIRHTDRTWTTTAVKLQGISGIPGAIAITGTL
ncbi:trypsin-like serine protease [Streptomyces sp. BR123]|uniref:trypsin-like serine protease n=1 Tax=Streptomyces sp. BR123 TaxID=2749828 RepID=UPI0015C466D1|nr:trypsin-like serine protease [Streptomyces sp. BR123]NXY95207.1 trypsin-like serine protease [Streptomyces sp. BR123]